MLGVPGRFGCGGCLTVPCGTRDAVQGVVRGFVAVHLGGQLLIVAAVDELG